MKVVNKKAIFDYEVLEKWEAGVVLTGAEVKSMKAGAVTLTGSRCAFNEKNELMLVGASVHAYEFSSNENYDPQASRKLLLTKKELLEIKSKMGAKGLTVVPLACYTKHGLVKVEIGLVRGKKKYEKRETEKKRAIDRGVQKLLKNKP